MAIEWRDIEGFPGYQVSNMGSVKSFKHKSTIILRPFKDKDGYDRVTLCEEGKTRTFSVHRLMLSAFKGQPPSRDSVARHLDDNPKNNNINNLVWGTALDNVHDRDEHERTCKGSKQHLSKLNEPDIPIIRQMIKGGKTDLAISKAFNVVPATIWFVRKGITWKHCEAR